MLILLLLFTFHLNANFAFEGRNTFTDSLDLDCEMKLSWKILNPNTIRMAVDAPTDGYVAIGFTTGTHYIRIQRRIILLRNNLCEN